MKDSMRMQAGGEGRQGDRGRAYLLALMVGACLGSALTGGAQQPAQNAYDGKTLFQQFCVVCHGGRGEGGQLGPSLLAQKVAAGADPDLYNSIASGNVEKGMPLFGRSLQRDEIHALVGYLRELQKKSGEREAKKTVAPSPIGPGGSAAAGEKLFKGRAGCIECHSVFYSGGTIGPDLTRVTERLSPGEIYEAVAEPSKRILRDYAAKVIVTKEGKKIEGRYRNETADSIQLLDKTGALWTTYLKKDLQSVESRKESLMPEGLLGKLNDGEKKDLFAYLYDLK